MFVLPELPYPADALEPYIDKQTMLFHHDKHHAAYVKNYNDLLSGLPDLLAKSPEEILKNPSVVPENFRQKVKNNAGGADNHARFWKWMSPAKPSPTTAVLKLINRDFGNLDTFREKFLSVAQNHFGSGWAWLVIDHDHLSVMETSNQDSPLTEQKNPLLAVDVWEHAYYLKYQNRRSEYLEAWWNVVNWTEVENLLISYT